MEAVREGLGIDEIVGVSYKRDETPTRCGGVEVEGRGGGVWAVSQASPQQAILVATDPTAGLMRQIGLSIALAVVMDTASGLGSAECKCSRQAALAGIPTIAVRLASRSASLSSAKSALSVLLDAAAGVLAPHGRLEAATNSPRAHFPFPERGRWASLVRDDWDWAREERDDWAKADGWSDAYSIFPSSDGGPLDREALRQCLRTAWLEGDGFIMVQIPPDSSLSQRFSSTKPGVLWRQEQVSLAAEEEEEGIGRDLWGRSLPAVSLGGDPEARFVPQLQTQSLIERQKGQGGGSGAGHGSKAGETVPGAILKFRITPGTVLHDSSPRGDADAVMRQRIAVSFVPMWPQGHPFALLDACLVESLREDEDTGLPRWIL